MKEESYYEREINGKTKKIPIKYLINENQVELKDGVITFGEWTNGENNLCFDKASINPILKKLVGKMLEMKQTMLVGSWQLGYSLSHGSGFLSKGNVETIRANVDKLSSFESDRLKTGFDEYIMTRKGEVKKKVD